MIGVDSGTSGSGSGMLNLNSAGPAAVAPAAFGAGERNAGGAGFFAASTGTAGPAETAPVPVEAGASITGDAATVVALFAAMMFAALVAAILWAPFATCGAAANCAGLWGSDLEAGLAAPTDMAC